MLYRENGQFKTTYRADQQIFPILQGRIATARRYYAEAAGLAEANRFAGPRWLALSGLALAGCSRSDRIPVYPVHGKVRVGGEPATEAFVGFHPAEGNPAPKAGPTDSSPTRCRARSDGWR